MDRPSNAKKLSIEVTGDDIGDLLSNAIQVLHWIYQDAKAGEGNGGGYAPPYRRSERGFDFDWQIDED